jgi:HEAT repeat protein
MPLRSAVLLFLAGASLTATAADDPVLNGRKTSEWLTMLKEDNVPRKRRAAVLTLGQVVAEHPDTRQTVLPAVARALRNDSNPGVRAQAAAVLGRQPAERAGLFLLDATEALRIEKDSDVRREIAVVFGRLGPHAQPAVQPLTEVLKDPAPATRAAAADALGRIGKEARAAAPSLAPLTRDADRGVQAAAAFALGRIDPDDREAAADALIALLAAERGRDARLTARAAVGSAATVGGRGTELVTTAIVSLGLLGEKTTDVVAAVANWLSDPDSDVRQQAALALGKFGTVARGAVGPLTAAFQTDADKLVRIYSLHALSVSFYGDAPSLIPVLTGRLKIDPDYEVRLAIAEQLGALGPTGKAAVPALREAQRDPQLKVREAASFALRRIQQSPIPAKP